jgi:hypothetical protein
VDPNGLGSAGGYPYPESGLTKRELFAAMAMQSLAGHYTQGGNFFESMIAEGSVKIADALLKELAK